MKHSAVIAGGGWGGVSAALCAKAMGMEVTLLERTDMLLGTGLVGGIMRNNGRFTAIEELIALGGGELVACVDEHCRHHGVEFPGHSHASLYDVASMEPAIRGLLLEKGVHIRLCARVVDVAKSGAALKSLLLQSGERVEGNAFIDATGTAGPMQNCKQYGNGCAMCILRCPSFGGRVSITEKAGAKEHVAIRADGGMGAMSGSCKLHKESLSKEILGALNSAGVAIVPLPQSLQNKENLALKACQQYALSAYAENIVLLDTGHAKLMSPYMPLAALRNVPGMEHARYEDPYAGGLGNSMRFFSMPERDDSLLVNGFTNLLCCGEKAGLLVGHTEAMVTGALAGYNAARLLMGTPPLMLPRELAVGDAIAWANKRMQTEEGRREKITFSGAGYFERMREKGLYITDKNEITDRVRAAGLYGVFAKA